MSFVGPAYMSNLNQMGPPPGANNVRLRFRSYYVCETLLDLRAIETDSQNETDFPMAILLGQDEKYDGLLQGLFFYVPEGEHLANPDSVSWVIVNDGRSAWKKLT
jgi:hypothetical protein